MPNHCSYVMQVVGPEQSVSVFLDRLRGVTEPSFLRMNLDDTVDYMAVGKPPYGHTAVIASGSCAWSVYSCMIDEGVTQAVKPEEVARFVRLDECCKELGVEVEIYSQEPGMGFAEHYHVMPSGEYAVSESRPLTTYTWETFDGTFEEFKKTVDLPDYYTENDVYIDENFDVGGFEEEFFEIKCPAMGEPIAAWYAATYPTDSLAADINGAVTFKSCLDRINMNAGSSLYEYIGVGDSLVRERIFDEMADRLAVIHNLRDRRDDLRSAIYEKWLDKDAPGVLEAVGLVDSPDYMRVMADRMASRHAKEQHPQAQPPKL